MERGKREKLRRQAAATAVAAVASAGVMIGGVLPDDGVFDNGDEELPTPIVETVPLAGAGGDAPEAETASGNEEEKKKAQRMAARLVRLPFGARVLAAAGIGGAAWLAATGVSALLGTVLPAAAAAAVGWCLAALALAAGFIAFFKAAFPEKRLRDVIRKKRLRWLLGGAAAIVALGEMLPLLWAEYPVAAALGKIAGGVLLLGGTLAVVSVEKHRKRKEEEAAIETPEEPKPETMDEARRRVLRMADESAEFHF